MKPRKRIFVLVVVIAATGLQGSVGQTLAELDMQQHLLNGFGECNQSHLPIMLDSVTSDGDNISHDYLSRFFYDGFADFARSFSFIRDLLEIRHLDPNSAQGQRARSKIQKLASSTADNGRRKLSDMSSSLEIAIAFGQADDGVISAARKCVANFEAFVDWLDDLK